MEKARVRSIARMVLYVGVGSLAYALLLAVQVFNGDGGRPETVRALVAATLALILIMPAGFAFAMAKE